MSVARILGLTDLECGPLLAAGEMWPAWVAEHPVLAAVGGLDALPGWTLTAARDDVDAVLGALANLAATDGGDDIAAAAALAWVLLPGASWLAWRLRRLDDRIDDLVAAQLWIEVRTFGCRPRARVAANLLLDTRKGVLTELGVGVRAARVASRTIPVEPMAPLWQALTDPAWLACPREGEALVADLLERATAEQVLTVGDARLLWDLAEAADRAAGDADPSRCTSGMAGLMGVSTSAQVGHRLGMSGRTVRRRARASVQALTAAYAATEIPVSA